ncbi:class I SAM-dependent methyltransferase [Rhizobium leguminosarum bv. viciae 248]|uniref:class I SAM-dependent methyltransferase n=2 Tax=Rhizobium leguminosarum TaxID=384 RepID=UPI0012BB854E|nr:class I SAM-dependent methyltransferase [Rhizobium leguminosarum]MCA2406020.1 class I SAM-dependent methyltransferase [Rhizobium leguminosarum]NKM63410.1 methyltransferase domain-containing protein [Rhizobium leguminosarum bv. viciae]QHW27343.1 class I SAM-dependent methyltransferase [Rhizobium leguminosarum bv. viciae 248]
MQNSDRSTVKNDAGPTWIPQAEPTVEHPHMTDDFARVYEMTANRNTGQIAAAALDRVGDVRWGTQVLDIAAGAGALSVPAALRGAAVLAVDNAPGMVNLLSQRLAPFPASTARLMDGQMLALEDEAFDATFSLIGASIFPDWRRGLAEQVRVTRTGGKACVATWRKLPGGGPFLVMAEALRAVYPNMAPPAPPEGFTTLADPGRLGAELKGAGLSALEIEEIEVVWEGPAGQSYLDDVRELHGYMGAYATLDDNERRRVDDAILTVVDRIATDNRVVLRSTAVLAVGTRQ